MTYKEHVVVPHEGTPHENKPATHSGLDKYFNPDRAGSVPSASNTTSTLSASKGNPDVKDAQVVAKLYAELYALEQDSDPKKILSDGSTIEARIKYLRKTLPPISGTDANPLMAPKWERTI